MKYSSVSIISAFQALDADEWYKYTTHLIGSIIAKITAITQSEKQTFVLDRRVACMVRQSKIHSPQTLVLDLKFIVLLALD